jgi:glyoxylase-like metal-dependent hydrolase (beta-lactamase superfamily II)
VQYRPRQEKPPEDRMPAPMQGEPQPNVYRFKIGEFEIANILDGKVIRDGLHPSFGPERSAKEAEALCRNNAIEANRYVHPFIPTLINTGKELILFDTGNGALSRDYPQLRSRLSEGRLVEGLTQLGYKPSDVDIVVVTHGHPDHIGGLMDGGKPVFSHARYVFGATEFDFWKRGENVREARKFNLQLFQKLALPLEDRSRLIKPGDEVAPGIRAVDVSGHSPGMLAYRVESGGKRLLIWADTCVHYVMAIQRPDWHLDVDDDKDKAVAARKRILQMAAAEKLFVTGYHMPFPGIGMIDRTADGYRWVPLSYQLDL